MKCSPAMVSSDVAERTPAPVAVTTPVTEPEWKSFQPKDFIALDVEAVTRYRKYLELEGHQVFKMPKEEPVPPKNEILDEKKEKKLPKAAKLAVVRMEKVNGVKKYVPVYQETIKHEAGTYSVNKFTKRSSGIQTKNELRFGTPFHEVTETFDDIFKDKYHVTCGGGADYTYLELTGGDYKNFDLQQFYRWSSLTNPLGDAMSLRDIYFYYFKDDIQRGNHNAMIDAKATLKFF